MAEIKIDIQNKLNDISPILYGIFFEDINYGGDGGLYGELIANRSFEYYDRDKKCDKHKMCWETVGNAEFEIKNEKPINDVHTHYAYISGKENEGIKNIGFCKEGFSLKDGDIFDFSFYAMAENPIKLIVKICDDTNVYGQIEIDVKSDEWTKSEEKIRVCGECKNAYLQILLCSEGSVNIEFVSLFNSDTFCKRKNGLRRDMAEMLKELSPKFMRFPGGCIVEGRSFENMYNWKETIGSVEKRRTNWNRWQMEEYQQIGKCSEDYFQSYGLGYYEYFQFCEDIGAKPVPVMNVGMTCQWHEGLLVDTDKLDKWIQDIFDLIEFANADANTYWGSKRAEMGHKEPFGLEYIGIGNEQWGECYFERYEIFQKAISEKYPDIKLITSAGWSDCGKEFDIAVEWMKKNKDKAYAVDEHFYKSPEWFLENVNRYDNYDRTMPKVFAGEYAAHSDADTPQRKNNWYVALSEAAFLTGVEKNADHIVMTCYAPLFGRTNHQQWQPNLIWFDNCSVYGTPSYYVQKLFSENSGEYIVNAECDDDLYISASVKGKMLSVKIVNVKDEDKAVEINICGVKTKCSVTELYAEPDSENSHENPKNVYPKTREFEFDGKYDVKKYSLTVINFEIV